MNVPPFFSIVCTVYNQASHLLNLLPTVRRQSFQSWELLIVDNNSSDGLWPPLSRLKDERIRCYREPRHGIAFTRNTGIRNARGRWILFLDSGHLFVSRDTLSQLHEQLSQYHDATALFTHGQGLSSSGTSQVRGDLSPLSLKTFFTSTDTVNPVLRTEWLQQNTFPEDETIQFEQANYVWIPLLRKERVYLSPLVTHLYTDPGPFHEDLTILTPDTAAGAATYLAKLWRDFGTLISKEVGKKAFMEHVLTLYRYLAWCQPEIRQELVQEFQLPGAKLLELGAPFLRSLTTQCALSTARETPCFRHS